MHRVPLRLALIVALGALLGAIVSACGTTQPYRGMAPQAVLEAGMRHMEGEDWDDAIHAFEQVLFSFPDFQGAPQARFNLAEAFYNK